MPDSGIADGSSFTSSFFDTYVRQQVVVQCTSGARPTSIEGRLIYETDTDRLLMYDGTGWIIMSEPWQSYTPTLSQGASTNIAKTTTISEYMRRGGNCLWRFRITATASGTAGSSLTLTVPITGLEANVVGGVGFIFDLSITTRYVASLELGSTTTMIFGNDGVASWWGGTPNVAVANGDFMSGSIEYRMATRYS